MLHFFAIRRNQAASKLAGFFSRAEYISRLPRRQFGLSTLITTYIPTGSLYKASRLPTPQINDLGQRYPY